MPLIQIFARWPQPGEEQQSGDQRLHQTASAHVRAADRYQAVHVQVGTTLRRRLSLKIFYRPKSSIKMTLNLLKILISQLTFHAFSNWQTMHVDVMDAKLQLLLLGACISGRQVSE